LLECADVVLYGFERVMGFAGDLVERVLFDVELVNDEPLMGERGAHVVDGSSPGQDFVVFGLPLRDIFADGGRCDLEQERDLGVGEHAVLAVGLLEQAGRGVAFEIAELLSFGASCGLVGQHEFQYHRDEFRVGDGAAVGGSGVLVNGDPGGLSGLEMAGVRIERANYFGDCLHEDAPRPLAAHLRAFFTEEGEQGALEVLVFLRPELALVGIEAFVHLRLHMHFEPVAQLERFFRPVPGKRPAQRP